MNYLVSGVKIVESTYEPFSILLSIIIAVCGVVGLLVGIILSRNNKAPISLFGFAVFIVCLGLYSYDVIYTVKSDNKAHQATSDKMYEEYGIDFDEYFWLPEDKEDRMTRRTIEKVTTNENKFYKTVMITRENDMLNVFVPDNSTPNKYLPLETR